MGYSTEPIEQIDWFERYGKSPCLNHQPINSDALHGVIRNPIQQEEVVGKAFSGSVCSLPTDMDLLRWMILGHFFQKRLTSINT